MLMMLGQLSAPISNMISYSAGIVCSYSLNREWTFSDRDLRQKKRFMAFAAASLVSLLLNTGIVALLVPYASIVVAKALATVASYILNYALADLVVFRSDRFRQAR
jgi:putative flippase GtrA